VAGDGPHHLARSRPIPGDWSRWDNRYFAGDGATRDGDGDIWLLGRVDDVMNVSGHRLSTVEIESALVAHPRVAEAAVVGADDPVTGQAVIAFVILREAGTADPASPAEDIRQHVGQQIGPIAKPRRVHIVQELPKTRSGKIMRRLLRDIAQNRRVGDASTLADSTVMEQIRAGIASTPTEED
jgi:acetyl-CoA synthetase